MWGLVEIAYRQPLITRALPEKPRPAHVDAIMRNQTATGFVIKIGIRQIAGQRGVIVAQCGREQHGPLSPDGQIVMREIPGVAMEQALGAARPREHIAIVIEHGEGIAVLQGSWPPLLQGGCRRDEELRRRRDQLRRTQGRLLQRLGHPTLLRTHSAACRTWAPWPPSICGSGIETASTPGSPR